MEKLSHAYIISSASAETGVKKALGLASEMLCSSPGKRPCGVCRDCRKVRDGIHPDLIRIKRLSDDRGRPKAFISVEQIRDMRADAAVLPNEAGAKVYIIEEAETMNESAQNAALKLFEEPPEGVHFILCTSNPEKLLITVRSRCVSVSCNSEEAPEEPEIAALAEEYLRLLRDGKPYSLAEWCMENEGMDSKSLLGLLNAIKRRLIEAMRYSDGKKPLLDSIALIDCCLEYQSVNTGVKHIFGLLAVCSLPAKETRKKVD